ncbi:uncharacterized protein LOC124888018 [Capsicum annuum]|uniref:uncharacterized protein LOC124888018 n=1 Tax=Capsicum annuum TaxID=4072 RepID=UPI001FB0D7AE|nr:uncharacterized protein LOC124888018 [Capsicum annuum]
MWHFQRLNRFLCIISTSQKEEDEWLVYWFTHVLTEESDIVSPSPIFPIKNQLTIVPSTPTPVVVASRQLFKFHSRRREINDTCLAAVLFPSDLDLSIALLKGPQNGIDN